MGKTAAMKVKMLAISTVTPYEKNPRRNDAAVSRTAESIKEFGWQQPIVVDADRVVIAGHTRLKAALELGLKKIPVLIAENLTPEQVAAYRIADNRTGELAEWDWPLLIEEIKGLEDTDIELTVLGWTPDELIPLLEGDFSPPSDDGSDPHDPHSGTSHSVHFSDDAWTTIERAVEDIRSQADDPDMAMNRALELICAEHLA